MNKLLVLVLLLSGCHPDLRTPVNYQRRQTEFTVKLAFAPQDRVREICSNLGAWEGRAPGGAGVFGCTVYDTVTHEATIHTTEPTHLDDEATLTLGHEVLHAYGGRYHQ